MKKLCVLLAVLSLLLCSCDKPAAPAPSEPETQTETPAATAPEESSSESSKNSVKVDIGDGTLVDVPIIPGANQADINLGLQKNFGFPAPTISDGTLSAEIVCADGTNLKYLLERADSQGRLFGATFNAISGGGASFLENATDFLKFCATMPYDNAEQEKARDWVVENISTVADKEDGVTAVFGGVKFILFGNANMRGLEITAQE